MLSLLFWSILKGSGQTGSRYHVLKSSGWGHRIPHLLFDCTAYYEWQDINSPESKGPQTTRRSHGAHTSAARPGVCIESACMHVRIIANGNQKVFRPVTKLFTSRVERIPSYIFEPLLTPPYPPPAPPGAVLRAPGVAKPSSASAIGVCIPSSVRKCHPGFGCGGGA